MSEPIAVFDDTLGFLAAFRLRLAQLGMTCETLDAIAGWAVGKSGKILGEEPPETQANAKRNSQRWIGPESLDILMRATATKMALIEDPEATEKLKKSTRFVPRKRPMHANGKQPYIVHRQTRVKMQQIAPLGGLARAQKLTPARRRKIARLGAKARWCKPRDPAA